MAVAAAGVVAAGITPPLPANKTEEVSVGVGVVADPLVREGVGLPEEVGVGDMVAVVDTEGTTFTTTGTATAALARAAVSENPTDLAMPVDWMASIREPSVSFAANTAFMVACRSVMLARVDARARLPPVT